MSDLHGRLHQSHGTHGVLHSHLLMHHQLCMRCTEQTTRLHGCITDWQAHMACASKSRFPQQCAQYMLDYYYHHYYYYRIKLQPHGAADLQYVCRGAVTQYNTYYKCSLLGFAQRVCSFPIQFHHAVSSPIPSGVSHQDICITSPIVSQRMHNKAQ